MGCIGVESSDI